MRLTEPQQSVANDFHNRFGLPAWNSDEDARHWTRRLCEQMHFSFPNVGFGHKAGGGGRPPSTDVLALRKGNIFVGWDVIPNQGRQNQSFDAGGESVDLAGQEFIPVEPINHLQTTGGGNPDPDPDPDPKPLPVDLSSLHQKLDALMLQNQNLSTRLGSVEQVVGSLSDVPGMINDTREHVKMVLNFVVSQDRLDQLKAIFIEAAKTIRPKLW